MSAIKYRTKNSVVDLYAAARDRSSILSGSSSQ